MLATGRLKKVQNYKGFIIAASQEDYYYVFTKEEWSQGYGFRYEEFECCSLKEAQDFIESY